CVEQYQGVPRQGGNRGKATSDQQSSAGRKGHRANVQLQAAFGRIRVKLRVRRSVSKEPCNARPGHAEHLGKLASNENPAVRLHEDSFHRRDAGKLQRHKRPRARKVGIDVALRIESHKLLAILAAPECEVTTYKDAPVRLWSDCVNSLQRSSTCCGQEVRIQSAVGFKSCEASTGDAIDAAKSAADEYMAIWLQRQGKDAGGRGAYAKIEAVVGRELAVLKKSCEAASNFSVH